MKIRLTIPTDINEIKLRTYLRYLKKAQDYPEDMLDRLMLTVFYDLTILQIEHMNVSDVFILSDKLEKALNQKPPLTRTFELNGVKYGFVPNLDEMTLKEFTNLNEYQSDPQKLNNLMAILYRPIVKEKGELYEIEPYENSGKFANEFLDMPLGIALAAQVFFWDLGRTLIKIIPKSLKVEAEKSAQQGRQMPKNGAGEKPFTNLVGAMYEISKTSITYLFILAYYGRQWKATMRKLSESKAK